jgi:hypothetical protein
MEDNQIIISEEYGNNEAVAQESGIDSIEVTDVDNSEITATETPNVITDTNDMTVHNNLHDRDVPDAHPISAITNLREELDALNTALTPQTLYSNKYGVADYYEWSNGIRYNTFGYFVSIAPESNKIQICQGADVFGVTVTPNGVGFIGGYDKDKHNAETGVYDSTYALVATSGLIDVRCEVGAEEKDAIVAGDYVVPNGVGMARRATAGYGYKVVATDKWGENPYVTIAFNISADQIDEIGANILDLYERMDEADARINSAQIEASQASAKADQALRASGAASDTVDKLDGAVTDITDNKIPGLEQDIADIRGAADEARRDAIVKAEELAEGAKDHADAAFVQAKQDLDKAVVALGDRDQEILTYSQRSAEEAYSLAASIDTYSVGEYSQSYGLTFSQAQYVLNEGMVYIPTAHGDRQTHTETYTITNKDVDPNSETEKVYTFTKEFTPLNWYKWTKFSSKTFNVVVSIDDKGNPTTKVITIKDCYWWASGLDRVKFEPNVIPSHNNCDYWYINGEVGGEAKEGGYESDTLYAYLPAKISEDEINEGKVIRPEGWTKVSTLKGNVNNRITSMIRQTSNEIGLEVINARGSIAEINAMVTDEESGLASLAKWKTGEKTSNDAIITQRANGDVSEIVIQTLQEDNGKRVGLSSLVLQSKLDDEGNPTGSLQISADSIDFEGSSFTVDADNINFTAGYFGGTNLILNSSSPTTTNVAEHAVFSYSQLLEADTNYTVSFDIQKNENANVYHCSVYLRTTNLGLLSIEDNTWPDTTKYAKTFKLTQDQISQITANPAGSSPKQIWIGINGASGSGTVTISNAKLEKGSVATDWSPAPEDQVYAEQTVTGMKWRMLPSKCVWWNSKTSESAPLMRLDDNGLYVKGEVEADKGKIAGYAIVGDKLYSKWVQSTKDDVESGIMFGLYGGTTWNGKNLRGTEINAFGNRQSLVTPQIGDKINYSPVRFFAGAPFEGTTEKFKYGEFVVLEDGSLYAGAVKIEGTGTIAGWNIGENGISKNNVGLWSNGTSDTSLISGTSARRLTAGGQIGVSLSYTSKHMPFDTNSTSYSCSFTPPTGHMVTGITSVEVCDGRDLIIVKSFGYTQSGSTVKVDFTVEYGDNVQEDAYVKIKYKASAPAFTLLDDGSMYANAASISGNIIAAKGQIGGFVIDNNALRMETYHFKKGDYGWRSGFRAPGENEEGSAVALAIGYKWDYAWTNAPFYVTFDGTLHSTKGIFEECTFKSDGGVATVSAGGYKCSSERSQKKDANIFYCLGDTGCFAFTGASTNKKAPFNMVFGWSPRGLNPGGTAYTDHVAAEINGLIVQKDGTVALFAGSGTQCLSLTSTSGDLDGTWKCSSEIIIDSSRNVKHNIESLSDDYSILFDNLRPVRFKYNDGQSGRYHTGYILDELKSAMDIAGLNTSDLAAYCVSDKETGDGGIRYGEMVSLNTWQIQKLKPRVATLEEKVQALEAENAELKEQMAKLLNQD